MSGLHDFGAMLTEAEAQIVPTEQERSRAEAAMWHALRSVQLGDDAPAEDRQDDDVLVDITDARSFDSATPRLSERFSGRLIAAAAAVVVILVGLTVGYGRQPITAVDTSDLAPAGPDHIQEPQPSLEQDTHSPALSSPITAADIDRVLDAGTYEFNLGSHRVQFELGSPYRLTSVTDTVIGLDALSANQVLHVAIPAVPYGPGQIRASEFETEQFSAVVDGRLARDLEISSDCANVLVGDAEGCLRLANGLYLRSGLTRFLAVGVGEDSDPSTWTGPISRDERLLVVWNTTSTSVPPSDYLTILSSLQFIPTD